MLHGCVIVDFGIPSVRVVTVHETDLPQRKFPILVLIFGLNERLVSCHVPILMSSERELFH